MPEQIQPNPTRNINTVRLNTFVTLSFDSLKLYFRSEKNMETPVMNIKNGNTKSVGVRPFQRACSKGVYTYFHDPGLFTKIIPAIVIPLITSRDSIFRIVVPY